MSTIKRTRGNPTNRQVAPNLPPPITLDAVPSFVNDGDTVYITFDQPVSLRGIPAIQADTTPAELPTAAAPTTGRAGGVTLTYGGSVAAALTMTVGPRDPSIRTSTGGYMPQGVYAVPQT